MKNTRFILSLIVAVILASCSTGNMVTNGKGIQKRKYNDGYYVSFGHKNKKTSDEKVATESGLTSTALTEEVTPVETETPALGNLTGEPKNEILVAEELVSTPVVEPTVSEVVSSTEPLSVVDKKSSEEKIAMKPVRRFMPKMIYTKLSDSHPSSADTMTILLVILALFIPWLAVLIYEGATTRFWIDLLLWLIGIGLGWYLLGPGIGWLCALVAVVYAILIILGLI